MSRSMEDHFARVAGVYRDLRTTDREPVDAICESMAGVSGVKAADIGCGSGRYSQLLFDALDNLELTCVDSSREMLEELQKGMPGDLITRLKVLHSKVEDLALEPAVYDCVTSFNAVHHFDLAVFLEKVAGALKRGGQGFVYARTPEQNAKSVWGRFFPKFLEKENRLYRLSDMIRRVEETGGLEMVAARCFRFARSSTLERLLTQARNRHYSTFYLYAAGELESAVAEFETRIRENFPDTRNVSWQDGNTMLHFRHATQSHR